MWIHASPSYRLNGCPNSSRITTQINYEMPMSGNGGSKMNRRYSCAATIVRVLSTTPVLREVEIIKKTNIRLPIKRHFNRLPRAELKVVVQEIH